MARRREKLTAQTACTVLSNIGARGEDFHRLSSAQVDGLLDVADRFKYRKPKNANGSRGRYFHAHLERLCRR